MLCCLCPTSECCPARHGQAPFSVSSQSMLPWCQKNTLVWKRIRGLGLGEDDFILLCDILCNFISKLAGLFLESQNWPYEHRTFRFRFLTPPFPNLKSVQRVKMEHSSPFSPISVLSTSSQCWRFPPLFDLNTHKHAHTHTILHKNSFK